MGVEDQLVYESRNRNRQTTVAAVAGVLLLAGTILGLVGPRAPVNELTLGLIVDHRRGALGVIAAIVNGLAQIAIAWTLVYLFRCAKARAPSSQGFIPILAVIGAALSIISGVAYAIVVSIRVNDFVSSGSQTYDEAHRLLSGSGLVALQIAGQLASLIIAIAVVLVALQAMRVGLLGKFLGYVGMIAGALFLLPFVFGPIIQLYWLLAVAYLISGRWPSGVPAAWQTGRAEAWPSSAEMRARRVAENEARRERRSQRRGGGTEVADTSSEPTGATIEAPPAGGSPRTRSGTPKRKRKRRH